MRNLDIKNLYYITHIDNLPSILERGILSHERIQKEGLQPAHIYNTDIVNRRSKKNTPDRKSLWSYANLYFQPRNPMMYRVVHETGSQAFSCYQCQKRNFTSTWCFYHRWQRCQ